LKFPKNRANVFVVVRHDGAICGVFFSYEDADAYAGACAQEWEETTNTKTHFYVRLSTFYG
jgi:hypothetical protein